MHEGKVLFYKNCFDFFFNDTATTEIYTLSLHDALPISLPARACRSGRRPSPRTTPRPSSAFLPRSQEHTSELQSQSNFVCRLLLEQKKSGFFQSIDSADYSSDQQDIQHTPRIDLVK